MARTRFFQSRKAAVPKSTLFRHTAQQELSLQILPHAHLMALVEGRGEENEFLTVVFRVTAGSMLTVHADDEGRLILDVIFRNAINGLISVGDRYKKHGKFGFSGDDLKDIKEALCMSDELQKVCTRRQQLVVYQHTERFVGGFEFTLKNLKELQARITQ
jgi:hypothetical protein